MPDLSADLREEYQHLYDTCVPRPDRMEAIQEVTDKIRQYRMRYFVIETALNIPWAWIGAIHMMESGGDFETHLHNGDPLIARTVHAPKGRPKHGAPPFTWHASAFDALTMRGLAERATWGIPEMLYEAERWNGFGYRNRGIPSPYLWAGSQHYVKGKYRKDHIWDPELVSEQIGVALLVKPLLELEPPVGGPIT